MNRNIEIMAPVGSYEGLTAAIQGGAGSVYFGVGKLNMRSASSFNFGLDDLHQIVDLCQAQNIQTYLTVNTILYDEEQSELEGLLEAAKTAGVSAIIASDLAVIQLAREKGLEVHISTQANVSNSAAVRFFAQFADVIVLARELNLDQIRQITETIRREQIHGPSGQLVRIELFIHGALCVAISGRCYMSLHENNHSANRGACLQSCRRTYTVTDKETGYSMDIDNEYVMSPEDLCTIHILDHILEAGVEVLKIEGRARPPEYVRTVCEVYHEAIASIAEGQYTPERIGAWEDRLRKVFNRGFWNGYYLGQKIGGWSATYGSKATRRKAYVGKISNFFQRTGIAEVSLEAGGVRAGDELLVIGPTTGVESIQLAAFHRNESTATEAGKGDLITFAHPVLLRRGDKVYRWDDQSPKTAG